MKRIVMTLGTIVLMAYASVAWADPAQITVPCTINHDNWPPFSSTQWEFKACSAALPALSPYGAVEVSFAPITQIAPIGHPGWSAGCVYATPMWINAPTGVAVTTITDGTVVRALAINLRETTLQGGSVAVGVNCQ